MNDPDDHTDATNQPDHDCLAAGTLEFATAYSAPGVGQSWACTSCGARWSRIGDRFFPAGQGAHILPPQDVE